MKSRHLLIPALLSVFSAVGFTNKTIKTNAGFLDNPQSYELPLFFGQIGTPTTGLGNGMRYIEFDLLKDTMIIDGPMIFGDGLVSIDVTIDNVNLLATYSHAVAYFDYTQDLGNNRVDVHVELVTLKKNSRQLIVLSYDPNLNGYYNDIDLLNIELYFDTTVLYGYDYINNLIYDSSIYNYTGTLKTIYEAGVDESFDTGYQAGEFQGYNSGYNDGISEGYAQGISATQQDVYDKGYQEGSKDVFMANFDKWIVPAIIVVLIVGGGISIISAKRREGK